MNHLNPGIFVIVQFVLQESINVLIINFNIITFYMSLLVVRYPYSQNLASIPLKQNINNGATIVEQGMPMKPRYADNTATFSQGRQIFLNTPLNNRQLFNNLNCNTGTIRVETSDLDKKSKYVNPENWPSQDNWSRSNHTIHNRKRNQIGCTGSSPSTCLLNGKQNNITTSQEFISKKKNLAIGKGSKNTDKGLSYNDNNLYGAHTNYISVYDAKRRTRNGGYIVPPKCRGRGSGPTPPYVISSNNATYSCGTKGWPVSELLGGYKTSNKILIKTNNGVITK